MATRHNLAVMLATRGKLPEAEAQLRELLATYERKKMTGPEKFMTISNLGAVLTQQGKLAAAEKLAREALTTLQEKLPARHPFLISSRGQLGICLARQDKFDEAEKELVFVVDALEQTRGPTHARTQMFTVELIKMYERAGKPKKGKAYKNRMRENIRKLDKRRD